MMEFQPWEPLYLRTEDQAAMQAALDEAGLNNPNPHIIRLKPLPDLTEPTGETLVDGEGNEYPEMAPVPGYHVNVFVHPDHEAAYRAALADVLIEPPPETPHVKYAGCA